MNRHLLTAIAAVSIAVGGIVVAVCYDPISPVTKYPTGKPYKEVIELRASYTLTATDTVKIVVGDDTVYEYPNEDGEYIMFTINSAIAVFDAE